MFNFIVNWCKQLPAGDVFFVIRTLGLGIDIKQ